MLTILFIIDLLKASYNKEKFTHDWILLALLLVDVLNIFIGIMVVVLFY